MELNNLREYLTELESGFAAQSEEWNRESLSPRQEAELSLVCRPFYVTKAKARNQLPDPSITGSQD
jgi:hypothetical protein